MAAPTLYKSTDASAPVLTGTVGSLIAVLDACLVNGYGTQTAAGWTKPYSATNQAAYLPTSGQYLYVNDAASGSGGAKEVQTQGYETMTSISAGTNKFPSSLLYGRKSATADSTPRAWILVADGLTFYLFVLTGDATNQYQTLAFGAHYSFLAADAYKSILMAHGSSGTGGNNGWDGNGTNNFAQYASHVPAYASTYICRDYTGASIGGKNSGILGVGGFSMSNPGAGPNTADGKIYLSRFFLTNGTDDIRGYVRGVYQIVTCVGLNDGDTFSGTGEFAGRTFFVLHGPGGNWFAVETTAWDSST